MEGDALNSARLALVLASLSSIVVIFAVSLARSSALVSMVSLSAARSPAEADCAVIEAGGMVCAEAAEMANAATVVKSRIFIGVASCHFPEAIPWARPSLSGSLGGRLPCLAKVLLPRANPRPRLKRGDREIAVSVDRRPAAPSRSFHDLSWAYQSP
jgi:hypothetical protein